MCPLVGPGKMQKHFAVAWDPASFEAGRLLPFTFHGHRRPRLYRGPWLMEGSFIFLKISPPEALNPLEHQKSLEPPVGIFEER